MKLKQIIFTPMLIKKNRVLTIRSQSALLTESYATNLFKKVMLQIYLKKS